MDNTNEPDDLTLSDDSSTPQNEWDDLNLIDDSSSPQGEYDTWWALTHKNTKANWDIAENDDSDLTEEDDYSEGVME